MIGGELAGGGGGWVDKKNDWAGMIHASISTQDGPAFKDVRRAGKS